MDIESINIRELKEEEYGFIHGQTPQISLSVFPYFRNKN